MAAERRLHFAGDVIRTAAWLYYGLGKTQSEVAEALGVSRQTAAGYLAEAKSAGHVSISLSPDILAHNALSEALRTRYGLVAAHIVPSPESQAQERQHVGRAGADVLAELVEPGMTIGVSSGRTLSALADQLRPFRLDDAAVIQVSGSSIDPSDHSPEICAATVATALDARCLNLLAPTYLTTEALCTALCAEPPLRRHFDMVARSDLLVFGIGNLSPDTVFDQPDYLDDRTRDHYLKAGAVGIAFGRFFEPDGSETEGPLLQRTIAIDFATAATIPVRLAVCSGTQKIHALRAALSAGMITHLVLDTALAKMLVGEEGDG
ncbi:sugar-binding transcriptional regulator [Notoacmeibacter marinus]|uniref:sugar-binding transcriptional regulator n=1 Tax=Notoacmeibacter marinus TaxID=1876515 RepID=UPI001303E42B|nr:sugar-binding domain-containing protein [Notoacmeibacter marinus]